MTGTTNAPGRIRASGLVRFIAGQSLLVFAAFILLGVAFIAVTTRLERMTERLNMKAERLVMTHDFSNELLLYRRDMLLSGVTRETGLMELAQDHLEAADNYIERLNASVTDPGERRNLHEVQTRYAYFRESARQEGDLRPRDLWPRALRGAVDSVIVSVETYRGDLRRQMNALAVESRRLNRQSDAIVWTTILLMPFLLAMSGFALWQRIARPVFALIAASTRFGGGDMGARASVSGQDELSELGRTFNTMAEDIQAREKERHGFLCAVVHDISSPLTVISGAAKLISRKELDPEKEQNWLERILVQSERLRVMTDDLLENARIGEGQLQLDMDEADLAGLISGIVLEQRLLHPHREIRWQEAPPCMVFMDEKRIARVLSNLLGNAIKYSDEPAPIDVRLETSPERVAISIQDRGEGMTAEEIRSLFRPFSRLARARQKAHGTGLGLFSVKKIVEAHGGEFRIDSVPSEGTTARVEIARAMDFSVSRS